MKLKLKLILMLILVGLGVGMLAYGFVRTEPVYSQGSFEPNATPETQLVLEVSRGGIQRDTDGALSKTYSGKPPAACPT
jgi:hypothetical protein